jgi:hypothetical protein
VRLALTAAKDGSEMLVSWTTDTGAVPAPYAGVVRYGPTPAALTMTSAVADTRNYTLCNLPSPRLHAATMTGLVAGATYYYSISEPRCVATEPAQFTAPRAVGDAATAYPFTVFAYGDMGIVRFITHHAAPAPATTTLTNLKTPTRPRASRSTEQQPAHLRRHRGARRGRRRARRHYARGRHFICRQPRLPHVRHGAGHLLQ